MELVVPAFEQEPWPTLGPLVCEAIEQNLVFGPGDLRGKPAKLDDEQRAFIYRMYEVHPKGSAREGKRRFQRVHLSLRKGLRKTELAAWIAAVELHPEAPVRCDGFRRQGKLWVPVGRPVDDPYIPMLAYTEDQSEELGYGALYAILSNSNCAWVDDFDIGLQRIIRWDGFGKAVALANAPDQADGARTTFQHKDEVHRWVLPRHKETDKVTRMNLMKRPIADPWELETTTMYAPGEGSVAEDAHDYAVKVRSGEVRNPRLFYYHRQANGEPDDPRLKTWDGVTAAAKEASGIAVEWSDIEGIVNQFFEPSADLSLLKRMWLNMPVKGGDKAFDSLVWKACVDREHVVPKGALIVLGFDGSRYWDATALVATEVATGYQWLVRAWTRPDDAKEWEVPIHEVNQAVDDVFAEYEVWRMYADPSKWDQTLAEWANKYGDKRVVRWEVTRNLEMARACRAFSTAIQARELSHGGEHDALYSQHVGNCHRRFLAVRDDDGKAMWVIQKERPNSVHKIDAASAGVYSWRARLDALASGAEPAGTDILIAWDDDEWDD